MRAKRLTERLFVRLRPQDQQLIDRAAALEDRTVAEFARRILVRVARSRVQRHEEAN